MRRILALSFFPAFVPVTTGGEARLFNFYRALSKWYEVILLTSTHMGVAEERLSHGVRFVERRIPKDDHFARAYMSLAQHSGGGDLSGPALAASGCNPTLLHRAYLEEYSKADVVIHDSPFTVQYDLFAGLDGKPRIYNSYNCESQLYAALHSSAKSNQVWDIVRESECCLLRNSRLVFYCNDDDLEAFRALVPGAKFQSTYVPNGLTPIAESAREISSRDDALSAVFMGSGHPPNVRAAEFIAKVLAPKLPDVTFDIIGSCLEEQELASNIRRHGMVSDILKSKILDSADIALNPMEIGGGSNLKMLEYFARGIPVLSTPFGVRGIRASAGIEYIEAQIDDFAQTILDLKARPDVRSEIAAAGRSFAVKQYSWDTIAASAKTVIEDMLQDLGELQPPKIVLALNDYDSFSAIGGGGTRTQGLYAAVSKWSRVVFLCFSGDGLLRTRMPSDGIVVISVPKEESHQQACDRMSAQFHISVDDILAGRFCTSNWFLMSIYRELRKSARCMVVEHCYMAGLPISTGDRFVYSSQNHEAALKARLLEWHPAKLELVKTVEIIERMAVERSAAAVAVSEEDAEALVRGMRTVGPVVVVRNGALPPASGLDLITEMAVLRDQIHPRSVVFLGSAHMPNVEAAQHLLMSVIPKCSDVQFHFLGSVCDALQNVGDNVRLWGVVDEVKKAAILQLSALALNPVLSGSGSNVKVADYLGNGLFVLTTKFGLRGYPEDLSRHVHVIPIEKFPDSIQHLLAEKGLFTSEARAARQEYFRRELSMEAIAGSFRSLLQSLEKVRKRVLYVTYRYVSPALGGAEVNVEEFVRALGESGDFEVNVIAPEVSGIYSQHRFGESYSFDRSSSAPVGMQNVRFARFPMSVEDADVQAIRLKNMWRCQPRFERALSDGLEEMYAESGLTWGWGSVESTGDSLFRWAFFECGFHFDQAGDVVIEGYALKSIVATALCRGTIIGGPWVLEGDFCLRFTAPKGRIELETSAAEIPNDPRPLAFLVRRIVLPSGEELDLTTPPLVQRYLPRVKAELSFELLDSAAKSTRAAAKLSLTDGRGPRSDSLEQYIIEHITEYDLVVTHNNVFRPPAIAIAAAAANGVPSVLIPHTHLDDDFYHFPDLRDTENKASVVLVSPKVACDFLKSKGANARYLPAGCDLDEKFTEADIYAFREIFDDHDPFILVLGRKAGAKGYRKIIAAVEELNRLGTKLNLVMIGPDDDGQPVDSALVTYLGRQPRTVVRGALMSCAALCNMSVSESFGIVLLEAWLAGKPVIANTECSAFHDMAKHGENALLVTEVELTSAIQKLLDSPQFGAMLAKNGMAVAELFGWKTVSARFVEVCRELTAGGKGEQ